MRQTNRSIEDALDSQVRRANSLEQNLSSSSSSKEQFHFRNSAIFSKESYHSRFVASIPSIVLREISISLLLC